MEVIELARSRQTSKFINHEATLIAAEIGFVVCAATDSKVSIRPSFENFQFQEGTPTMVTFSSEEITTTYPLSTVTLLVASMPAIDNLRLWVCEFGLKTSKQEEAERKAWLDCQATLHLASIA